MYSKNIAVDTIPIRFSHHGKNYVGEFSLPHGTGGNVWFLKISNYYCGQLVLAHNNWAFHPTPKTEPFRELAAFFGDYLIGWYQ